MVLAGHVVSCGAVLLVSNRQRRRWPEFKIQTVSLPELLNDPHHPNHPSRWTDHTARAHVRVRVWVWVWVCVCVCVCVCMRACLRVYVHTHDA